MLSALRRLAAFCLCLALCFGLAACSGDANGKPATISPDDMAVIRRQVEGFTAAKERLPELAQLVNERDWTFTVFSRGGDCGDRCPSFYVLKRPCGCGIGRC